MPVFCVNLAKMSFCKAFWMSAPEPANTTVLGSPLAPLLPPHAVSDTAATTAARPTLTTVFVDDLLMAIPFGMGRSDRPHAPVARLAPCLPYVHTMHRL